jgi:hypothetical protein
LLLDGEILFNLHLIGAVLEMSGHEHAKQAMPVTLK